MWDSERTEIVRVQLAGVRPGVLLGHIDDDEICPSQADPVVSLHVHRDGPNTSGQDPGAVLPDQDNWTEVGDLKQTVRWEGRDRQS